MRRYRQYVPIDGQLRVGLEAALARVQGAARRDSYRMTGELKLLDELNGVVRHIVAIDGEWYEGIGLEDAG